MALNEQLNNVIFSPPFLSARAGVRVRTRLPLVWLIVPVSVVMIVSSAINTMASGVRELRGCALDSHLFGLSFLSVLL